MKQGLLWFDDDPSRDLAEKIRPAARRYIRKHGIAPEVCYVHPSALLGDNAKVKHVGAIRLASRRSVLRDHFWLGREEKRRRRPAPTQLPLQETAP